MVVQVEGMDISPTEISEEAGWCTISRRERLSPAGKHANPNISPASQAGVGGTNKAQQRPRAHKQQILKAGKMPTLPRDHHKVVIRPRGGLNVATVVVVRLASALYRAASVSPQDAMEDIVCPNIQQNIIVKRRGDRQRAEAEAALALQQQNYDEHFPPASRSRSRGRTRSRSAAEDSISPAEPIPEPGTQQNPRTEPWSFKLAASEASRPPGPGAI
ncbi:hypothetical protein HPB49_015014 [Dermacentor silvarum]|uniref:Uncharacterized protein n=1 Tax=Dermacentor silvarum TaxID=543639 RepID=A0ACB8DE15_DERSI|nr:hypothetical protein HPB49_015014 [Dermacentor silvarum]